MLKSSLILLLLAATTTGCGGPRGESGSQTADIATDLTSSAAGAVYLYYRNGDQVVRSRCPEGVLAPSRLLCGLDPVAVSAKWFFDKVSEGVGARLEPLDRARRELVIRIADIDGRLIEMLAVRVDPVALETQKARMRELEARIGAVEIRIRELEIQIAAIRAELARSTDPNLALQLAEVEDTRARELKALTGLTGELAALRKTFVVANSGLLAPQTFQNLWIRREELVQQLGGQQAAVDLELRSIMALHSVVAMVNDRGFTTEILGGSASFPDEKAFVRGFEKLFGPSLPRPGDCRGLNVPGDYHTLTEAVAALKTVGGTICLGEGAFTGTGTSLGLYPQGEGLTFEVAGAGMGKTSIPSVYVSTSSCKGCTIGVRDLTTAEGFSISGNTGQGHLASKVAVSRVAVLWSVSVSMYNDVTLDAVDVRRGLTTNCGATAAAALRVTSSYIQGNGGQSDAVSLNQSSTAYDCGVIELVNNTIANAQEGIDQDPAVKLVATNNLLVRNRTGLAFGNIDRVTHSHNALFHNVANYTGEARPGDAYVTSDPQLDFDAAPPVPHLTSPLRRVGKREGAPLTDFYGKVRDVGVDIGAVQR